MLLHFTLPSSAPSSTVKSPHNPGKSPYLKVYNLITSTHLFCHWRFLWSWRIIIQTSLRRHYCINYTHTVKISSQSTHHSLLIIISAVTVYFVCVCSMCPCSKLLDSRQWSGECPCFLDEGKETKVDTFPESLLWEQRLEACLSEFGGYAVNLCTAIGHSCDSRLLVAN